MNTPEEIDGMMTGTKPDLTCSPILPNLQAVSNIPSTVVSNFETKFEPDIEVARRSLGNKLPIDDRSVPVLLVGYFKWLTWLIDNSKTW
jgi:hypothetical protein